MLTVPNIWPHLQRGCGISSRVGPSNLLRRATSSVRVFMRLATSLFIALLLAAPVARAEIEKVTIPGEKGMSLYWWPKLPTAAGWHQDRHHSFKYGVNALAPDGATVANAETVMYAKAVYKPREPEIKSLATLIERDKKEFLANVPGVEIQE